MRALLFVGLCLAAVVMAGACGEGGQGTPGEERPGETPTVRPSLTPGGGGSVGDLQLRFDLDKTAYRQGQAIQMSLTVTNRGNQPLILSFSDSQRYDFTIICGPDARCAGPIWQWSRDKVFAQVLGQESLAPGQSVTYSETWDQRDNDGQPVAPNSYQAQASLVGCPDGTGKRCDALMSDVVAFQVMP